MGGIWNGDMLLSDILCNVVVLVLDGWFVLSVWGSVDSGYLLECWCWYIDGYFVI